jgi:uncharacterized repeat protein (TIGR01451 family)
MYAIGIVAFAVISLIFGRILVAQQATVQRHVALPWDPSSGVGVAQPTGPLAVPLSSTAWTSLGPAPISNGQRPGSGPVSGRLTGIAASPTDANTIYVAAAGGGVWKTTNGGTTWTPLTDVQSTVSMGAIAVAPSNPAVVYAGTGEANNSGDSNSGHGVLVSTDAGATWTLSTAGGAFDRRAVSEIAVDPTNPNIAYAAIAAGLSVNSLGGNSGIWKTTDGGATWSNTTTAITSIYPWSSVRSDPTNPSVLYAAVGYYAGNTANGVYKSTNAGVTWALLPGAPSGTTSGRIVVAVAPSNPQVVYVSSSSPSTFGLFKLMRSDNGGLTFTDLTGGTPNYMGGQGWYDTTLIVDPSNSAIVYAAGAAGTNSMLRSTNSGANWSDISATSLSNGPHVDHHAAAFDASGRFLDGDDGGIYRLDNPATIAWTQLNGNLSTIQFQGIGMHPSNINIVLGGSQDNGTSMYTGALSWSLVEGGDGGQVKFSKTNTSRVYHQAPVGSFGSANFFRRSDSGGTSGWLGKVSGITDPNSQNFYAPFAVDPGNGDRVLYGTAHVNETTNGGDSWTPLGAAFPANVDAIGLAPTDVNTIYASAGGSTYFTNNHGIVWTLRNLPVSGSVDDIEVDPADSLTAYAVQGLYPSAGNVFRTINGGVTWTNISGNLPIAPVWSLQIDPGVPGTLYVGTEAGVYRTINTGVTWSPFGIGFPNAQVFQLELNPTLRVLGAATHGRGAWEILIPAQLNISKTHTGNFTQGQVGATYTVTVGNIGAGPTSGTVTMTETPPSGLTVTGMSGTGWTCNTTTCTRSDSLSPGNNYPAITVTVNVASNASSPLTNVAGASGGGDPNTHTVNDSTIIVPSTDLGISKTHSGNFTQGQIGAAYTITVSNLGPNSTSGTVTVTDSAPAELTPTALSGSGWSCTLGTLTCQRSDVLTASSSYPAITLTVNVSNSAPSSVTNSATVSGGGDITPGNDTANDLTNINPSTATALRFIPVPPCRVVDTRNPNGPLGGPSLLANTTRDFPIPSSSCGIPSNAKAYSLNATVVPHGSLGYLTLWPTGSPQPLVSALNSPDGGIKANAAVVPAGTGGAISVYVTDTTDVILDTNGYFLDTTGPTALQFYPLTPCRVADTRNPVGPLGGPILAGGSSRSFPILSSSCGIPAAAQAYVLNATVVPSGPLGYLTLWPTGSSQPFVSTLNAPDAQITANMAIVPAGTGGAISAFVTDNTHLVLDISGYFAPAGGAGALNFFTLTPCRVWDTRGPNGPLGGPIMSGNTSRSFPLLSSSCGIPAASQAYSLHATVVPSGPLGYLTVWPTGAAQPLVSTLNALDGQIRSNSLIPPAGTSGSIDAFVTDSTHLVVDINGYFAP